MEWIYISPHLDDVALSLGGLVWEQTRAEWKVSIWSICAGDPPGGELSPFAQSLQNRWETGHQAMDARRREDIKSCQILGVRYYHFNIPDCIYRHSPKTGEHLYCSEEDLWLQVHPDEKQLIDRLSQKIRKMLPEKTNIVCPLSLGNHIDHRLTRQSVEAAVRSVPQNCQWHLFFYADYPYVLDNNKPSENTELYSTLYSISADGILSWQEAIARYQSQISTFWNNIEDMRTAIRSYYDQMGGLWLGHYKC